MSTKYGGYMGRVAEVDLTTQTVTEYPWTDRDRELFIGGKIMGAKILFDRFTGSEKPFSEENLIVITTGPLTGTGAPSSGRFNLSTLSPQEGRSGCRHSERALSEAQLAHHRKRQIPLPLRR